MIIIIVGDQTSSPISNYIDNIQMYDKNHLHIGNAINLVILPVVRTRVSIECPATTALLRKEVVGRGRPVVRRHYLFVIISI